MRDFLLTSCPILLWVFMAFHLIFFVLLRRRFMDTKNVMFLLSAAVTFGLLFDAFILALGTVMDASSLRAASRFRFVSHGALIPMIFPICVYALNAKPLVRRIVSIFTVIMVIAGIAEGFATVLEVKEIAGVVRYASSAATPAWASAVSSILSYGTVVPLIIVGIAVWIKQKTPTLFLSGFLMFLFSALGPATGNFDLIFFISMVGEVLMVLFFYAYAEIRLYSDFMTAKES